MLEEYRAKKLYILFIIYYSVVCFLFSGEMLKKKLGLTETMFVKY